MALAYIKSNGSVSRQDLSPSDYNIPLTLGYPLFLGGVINPGADAALRLAQQLGAEYVTNTHDDAKPGKT